MSTWSHGLLNLLVCVGLLVVMPLGLRLAEAPGVAAVRRLWHLAATPAAASVWLPRGWLAAALAAAYVPATAALLTSAGRVLLPRNRPAREKAATRPTPPAAAPPAGATPHAATDAMARTAATAKASPHAATEVRARAVAFSAPHAVALATALAAPAVAACALVSERAGHHLFGFDLDVLALTVAHFHYAGFAAALIAGLVCEVDGDSRTGRLAAVSVPAGVAAVFAGFFTSEWVELAGAAVLTAGMWLVGWLTWRQARARTPARGLLVVSAGTLAATMVLALDWALGQAVGLPHLPISWMVATHGLANALGFALCALVAWQRSEARQPTAAARPTGAPQPAVTLQPRDAPQPTAAPQPRNAARPTGAPQTTEAPQPRDAPPPTKAKQQPTETPQPTAAPQPTNARQPANAPRPTREPQPPGAPQPTGAPQQMEARQPAGARQPTARRQRMGASSEWR